jgi:hypothetical protein
MIAVPSKRETHSDNRAQRKGAREDASGESILQNCPDNGLCPESKQCQVRHKIYRESAIPGGTYRSKALWSPLR